MPDAVITTAGRVFLLGRLVFGEWSIYNNFRLAVFTNNATPNPTSTLADFDRSGIAPSQVEMLQEGWMYPDPITPRARTYWNPAPTEFTALPTTITAYGYLVWEPTYPTLLWAQRFDSPIALVAGQVVRVWPYLDYGACP